MTEPQTDAGLIQCHQSGDRQAFGKLYHRHSMAVFTYLCSRARQRDTAEDLLQETFIRAFQHIDRLAELPALRPYLLRIARNLLADAHRNKRQRTPASQAEEPWLAPGTGDSQLEQRETAKQLQHALEQLPDEQREAVVLHVYSNLNFREIAETTDSNINTVIYRYRSALKKLKEILDGTL